MFSYIAPGAKQYRANLHSHTNLSDGTLTPEQMVHCLLYTSPSPRDS